VLYQSCFGSLRAKDVKMIAPNYVLSDNALLKPSSSPRLTIDLFIFQEYNPGLTKREKLINNFFF